MLRRELVIASLDDIQKLCRIKDGVATIIVKRNVFDKVEHVLRKNMALYTIEEITDNHVVLVAGYPEHMCHIHRDVLQKSQMLANPYVIALLLKISKPIGYHRVKDPFELARILNKTCSRGYKFIFITSRSVPSRAYIVCGGTTASILAIVYDDYETVLGVQALRYVFHRLPLDMLVYSIRTECLDNT